MIDADDATTVLHTDLILHRTGYSYVDDVVRLDGSAGLTDLLLVWEPAQINRGPGRSSLPTKERS